MAYTIKDDGSWVEEELDIAEPETFSIEDPFTGEKHLIENPNDASQIMGQMNQKKNAYLRDMYRRNQERGEYVPGSSNISISDFLNLTDIPGKEEIEPPPEVGPKPMAKSEPESVTRKANENRPEVQRGGGAWRREGDAEWQTMKTRHGLPEEDYEEPLKRLERFSDREGFQKSVISQIGVNPFEIDIQAEIRKADKNLPKLFHQVFQGRITWNDRDLMTKEEKSYWHNVVRQYHADVQNQIASKKKMLIDKFNYMMNTFDNQRAIELEKAKRTYEMLDRKIWVHNPVTKAKLQVTADEIDDFIGPAAKYENWKIGQPFGKEERDEVWVFNEDLNTKRKVSTEEAEKLKGQGWKIGQPISSGIEDEKDERAKKSKRLEQLYEAHYKLNKPDPDMKLAKALAEAQGKAIKSEEGDKEKEAYNEYLNKEIQRLEKEISGISEAPTGEKKGPFKPGQKVKRKDGKVFTADENGFLPQEAYTK